MSKITPEEALKLAQRLWPDLKVIHKESTAGAVATSLMYANIDWPPNWTQYPLPVPDPGVGYRLIDHDDDTPHVDDDVWLENAGWVPRNAAAKGSAFQYHHHYRRKREPASLPWTVYDKLVKHGMPATEEEQIKWIDKIMHNLDEALSKAQTCEYVRQRFINIVPGLASASWEDIWERVRDRFRNK